MREKSVVGGMPSSAAAPSGPETLPFDCASAQVMASRSRCFSSCLVGKVAGSNELRKGTTDLDGGNTSSRSGPPSARMTARSIELCNSRMFPGQSWAMSSRATPSVSLGGRRRSRRATSRTKCSARRGISSRRSRRGDSRSGKHSDDKRDPVEIFRPRLQR